MTKIHIWVKFGDDWSNGATCILLTTSIRTDKQTDEKAIGDCVLAKISKMIINRKIVMTTVMIENILKLVQHLESQSNSPHVGLFVRRSSLNINQVTAVQIVDTFMVHPHMKLNDHMSYVL